MSVPLIPVAELANPVNRPGNAPWGADQAQQPTMSSCGFSRSVDGSNGYRHREHTPFGSSPGTDLIPTG
jgi:hypothetical protein